MTRREMNVHHRLHHGTAIASAATTRATKISWSYWPPMPQELSCQKGLGRL